MTAIDVPLEAIPASRDLTARVVIRAAGLTKTYRMGDVDVRLIAHELEGHGNDCH